MDNTLVKNICESLRKYLDQLPRDKWEVCHYKVAQMIGYEVKK